MPVPSCVSPRAAAVVIHGGAGTTSEALRAGRPITAVRFAFDQFQMANEVEAVGAGIRVRKRDRSLDKISSALTQLISDVRSVPPASGLATSLSSLSSERDGAQTAAELIEQLPTE